MKRLTLFALLALIITGSAMAWDTRGHAAIAYIAERHLTPRAKANIEQYLGGRSLVYYSAWMDFNRTEPPFDITRDWHVDYWTEDMRYDAEGKLTEPRSIEATKRIIGEMADFRALPDSLVTLNIKFLTHLVGDIHCPVHVNFAKTRPWRVYAGKKQVKFHAMWDGHVVAIKHKGHSPMSLAELLDIYSPEQIAQMQKGDPDQWHAETTALSDKVVEMMPENRKLTNINYFNEAIRLADYQFALAGYRLAKILNTIFDK